MKAIYYQKQKNVFYQNSKEIYNLFEIINFNSHLLEKYCPYDLFISLDYNQEKNKENLFLWNGQIFIKEGVYTDLNITFKIIFSNNYPNTPPEVVFDEKIFHPLIEPNINKLDIKYLFPEWTPGKNCVIQILYKIKDIFLNPKYFFVTNSLNEESGKMFCDDYIKFESKIKEDIDIINNKNKINNNGININDELIQEFKNILQKDKVSNNVKQEQIENYFLFKYKNKNDK